MMSRLQSSASQEGDPKKGGGIWINFEAERVLLRVYNHTLWVIRERDHHCCLHACTHGQNTLNTCSTDSPVIPYVSVDVVLSGTKVSPYVHVVDGKRYAEQFLHGCFPRCVDLTVHRRIGQGQKGAQARSSFLMVRMSADFLVVRVVVDANESSLFYGEILRNMMRNRAGQTESEREHTTPDGKDGATCNTYGWSRGITAVCLILLRLLRHARAVYCGLGCVVGDKLFHQATIILSAGRWLRT